MFPLNDIIALVQ